MGSSTSKSSAPSSQHVFASDAPVRFSQELIDSLQTSSENDSTREKTLELHVQSRVADELKRLEARESQTLKELEEKIAAEPAEPMEFGSGHGHDGLQAEKRLQELGRENIQKEITALRQRLESRKKLRDLDRGVKRAKDEVVSCLRTHDRRPLDCWKEVETFKKEVARLEEAFVDRALR